MISFLVNVFIFVLFVIPALMIPRKLYGLYLIKVCRVMVKFLEWCTTISFLKCYTKIKIYKAITSMESLIYEIKNNTDDV